MPRVGWQPFCGTGGSFAVESVAAFVWNRWQVCYGISGSFRVEQVAALPWNRWQDSPGIGGSFGVEYAHKPINPIGGCSGYVSISCTAYTCIPNILRLQPHASGFVPLAMA